MNISIQKLTKINVEGGDVFHAIKKSEDSYDDFGELYFSWIDPGYIKAWKRHKVMKLNLVVPYGLVKFVVCQDDKRGIFKDIVIGNNDKDDKYSRLTIEPGTWFGFKGLAKHKSLVVNLANIEHDPKEADTLNLNSFEYSW